VSVYTTVHMKNRQYTSRIKFLQVIHGDTKETGTFEKPKIEEIQEKKIDRN